MGVRRQITVIAKIMCPTKNQPSELTSSILPIIFLNKFLLSPYFCGVFVLVSWVLRMNSAVFPEALWVMCKTTWAALSRAKFLKIVMQIKPPAPHQVPCNSTPTLETTLHKKATLSKHSMSLLTTSHRTRKLTHCNDLWACCKTSNFSKLLGKVLQIVLSNPFTSPPTLSTWVSWGISPGSRKEF